MHKMFSKPSSTVYIINGTYNVLAVHAIGDPLRWCSTGITRCTAWLGIRNMGGISRTRSARSINSVPVIPTNTDRQYVDGTWVGYIRCAAWYRHAQVVKYNHTST